MFRDKLTKSISVLITLFFLFSTVFSSPVAAQVFIPSASVTSTPYTYNALNQVTAVSVNGVALANYAFDPLNRLTTKNLLGGSAKSAVFGYDAADQLLSLENKTTAVISKHTYLYDKAGNRLRHDNQAGAAAVKTLNFVYNKIYELTTTTGARPTKPGTYRIGAATLQPMYAPEMTARSDGFILNVEGK